MKELMGKYTILQENGTIPIDNSNTDPIGTPTAPVVPVDGIDFGVLGPILAIGIGAIILFIVLWWFLRKEEMIQGADIRPSIEDMNVGGMEIGKYMAFNGILVFATMFAIMGSFAFIVTDPILAGLGMGVSALSSYSIKAFLRDQARSDTTQKNLEGVYRNKAGKKGNYSWKDVQILDEYEFTAEDKEIISREMVAQPGLVSDEITEKDILDLIENVFAYPVVVNNYWEVIVLTRFPKDTAFDWVIGFDYDMHGDYQIEVASPELRELGTIHKITDDPYESYYKVNSYVPVLMSIWDDGYSRGTVEKFTSVDTTNNHVLVAMLKALVLEKRQTAGEINVDRAALVDFAQGDEDFDSMLNSRSRKKAMRLVENEKALSDFTSKMDHQGLGYIWVLLICAIVAWGFYQAGWNDAVTNLVTVGMVFGGLGKSYFRLEKPDKSVHPLDALNQLYEEGNEFIMAEAKTLVVKKADESVGHEEE